MKFQDHLGTGVLVWVQAQVVGVCFLRGSRHRVGCCASRCCLGIDLHDPNPIADLSNLQTFIPSLIDPMTITAMHTPIRPLSQTVKPKTLQSESESDLQQRIREIPWFTWNVHLNVESPIIHFLPC